MTALVMKGEYVDLSYYYDGLTVYYRFPELDLAIFSCVNQCKEFPFVIKPLDFSKSLRQHAAEKSIATFDVYRSGKIGGVPIQRVVMGDDDDHELYHQDQDSFNSRHSHCHLKFKQALTRDQFDQILNVFQINELILKEQHEFFMKQFDLRYASLCARADEVGVPEEKDEGDLPKQKKKGFEALLALIRTCCDNDKLVNLHEHLLSEKFDYLRVITEEHSSKEWQGMDRSGRVVRTSKAWATLEKAFSLQMIKNLQEQCERFSPKVGAERDKQFTDSHTFFGIKRTRSLVEPERQRTFKMREAFARADEKTLARKYEKVFRR